MIPRLLQPVLVGAARDIPVVAVTGPRQSGKTTLCKATFPDHAYVSLEPLDTREFAVSDPRGFLAQYPGPAIFDEVQRAPGLFSYLQESVDQDPSPGRFILTGSEHLGLSEAISQSLAGRISLLHLLPLSLEELAGAGRLLEDPWACVLTGGYPRIHDRGLDPARWLADYTATYVQRDVRQVLRVTDLSTFSAFLRLASGRTGQELNLSALGSDAGVTHPTIRSWISVLEATFVIFLLPPWLRNTRKRVIRASKLHFVDSGLACHLMGIRETEQLTAHPLRGALFESWVASELLKWRTHRGLPAELFHLREARGLEVDLIVQGTRRLIPVEVKSAQTVATGLFRNLAAFAERTGSDAPHLRTEPRLLYAGEALQERADAAAVPWNRLHELAWD